MKNIILAILAVLAIIFLTWYAFRQETSPEPEPAPAAVKEEPARTDEGPVIGSLPEKAPDAVDFSPTPETRAAAEARPVTSPPRKSSGQAAETKGAAKKAENRSKAASAETKKAGNKSEAAPAENPAAESRADTAAPAESPAAETASAENQAAGSGTETAPDDSTPDKSQAETASTGAQPAGGQAVNATAESPAAESAALAISDLWVVNISSTPDAAESLPLLTKVMAAEVGGQVYAYEATVEGVTRYRIRVGFFNTRAEAEIIGQKIKEDFKLSASPWVVKPTVDEVERYRKK